jgi:hypothetical protein
MYLQQDFVVSVFIYQLDAQFLYSVMYVLH